MNREVTEHLSDGTVQTLYILKWGSSEVVLTEAEMARALKRGKWYQRRVTEKNRAIKREQEGGTYDQC